MTDIDTSDMPDFGEDDATNAVEAVPEPVEATKPAVKPGKAASTAKAPGQVTKAGKAPPKIVDRTGSDLALVRITKTGHGHVHDGEGGFYDWNTELVLENANAEALQDRSFAEIIG